MVASHSPAGKQPEQQRGMDGEVFAYRRSTRRSDGGVFCIFAVQKMRERYGRWCSVVLGEWRKGPLESPGPVASTRGQLRPHPGLPFTPPTLPSAPPPPPSSSCLLLLCLSLRPGNTAATLPQAPSIVTCWRRHQSLHPLPASHRTRPGAGHTVDGFGAFPVRCAPYCWPPSSQSVCPDGLLGALCCPLLLRWTRP